MMRGVLATLLMILLTLADLGGQVSRGPPQLTTCSTPFRPISGRTFHGGYAWLVTYHTYPGQFGYAQYTGAPNPVTSTDGRATWTDPGVYVQCTLIWAYNPDGTVAYVEYNWHIISYFGTIAESGNGGCDGGGVTDPIYITSYDPYVPVPGDETGVSCGGGGEGGGSGRVTCGWDWVRIEISYDGGATWQLYWEGWTQVCVQEA